MNDNWLTIHDIKVGQRMGVNTAYEGATVVSVAKNGWCKLNWDDGREFSIRVHWLGKKD
jgi:hypothetical protein